MKLEIIFEKIAKSIRNKKKRREKEVEKYWKLPASERMHLDSIMEKINNHHDQIFPATSFLLLAYVSTILPLTLVSILFQNLDVGKLVFLFVTSIGLMILPFFIIADIIIMIILGFQKSKIIKQLKKRFKLE